MTMLPSSTGIDWGRVLSGLSGGLMAAGSPQGFSAFGPGLMQGAAGYDQRAAGEQARKMQELQQQLLAQQVEQNRLGNQRQAEEDAAIKRAIEGGMMANSGFSATQFGGAQMEPGLFDPQTAQQLKILPPSLQRAAVESKVGQMFAEPKARKTIEIAGQLVDAETGEVIKHFSQQEMALRTASRPTTTVNVGPSGIDYGDPPKGTAWARDPNGNVRLDERGIPLAMPIQGTPEFLAQQKADEAANQQQTTKEQNTDIVTTDINRALEKIESSPGTTTGIGGALLSGVPSTTAHDVSELIATVRANASIDKLQAMRAASPTGGALGNVTEQENKMLADTIGSLAQSQNGDQLKYNLRRVYNTYLDIVHGKGKGPQRYPLEAPAGPDERQDDPTVVKELPPGNWQ